MFGEETDGLAEALQVSQERFEDSFRCAIKPGERKSIGVEVMLEFPLQLSSLLNSSACFP